MLLNETNNKNDFRKETKYKKFNLNDQAIFWKFLQTCFCAGDKSWNDTNNYFMLELDIQLQ